MPDAKSCSKCGREKNLNEFGRDRSTPDGHTSACRACRAAQHRARRAADPEKAREKLRQWRARNLEKSRELTRQSVRRWREANREKDRANSLRWHTENPEMSRQRSLRTRDAARTKVFGHYGWACACCGSTERVEIDHVNGDGKAHRREIGQGNQVYFWLVRNGFPEGFQTLCNRCNRSKGDGPACRLSHGAEVAG